MVFNECMAEHHGLEPKGRFINNAIGLIETPNWCPFLNGKKADVVIE